ncbi:MAG TPA: lysophospholipid acyltransferase family protein [Thermoanaerobaculia bacterium]|jgi:1-acyl-sn-glycerol-3-phosphate acyltransferase
MRRFASAALRLFARIFWRRIEFVGLERVPASGAVIFAVNHPNGLLDPLFLICFAPRPVSFLAKAPLFRYPVIGWFVRAFDSIPVYRKQDHTKGTNAETFAKAREVLARGGTIAIFPEGTTHSDPSLRELKTGAARIALGAAQPRMTIIPTGIYYTAKQTFRSSALVVFGDAIDVAPQPVDANGEPPAQPVEQLTRRIDDGLDAVTIQADSHNALDLIGRAENIFTADAEQSLGDEFMLRRRFIDGYRYLRERDPQRLARLESAITQFGAELGKAKLEAHELAPAMSARTLFRVLVLLPLAIVGLVLHYPTYRAVGMLAKIAAKQEGEMTATMKFLAALLLFPITWILYAILSWRLLGHAWLAVPLPLLGWIALRVFEDLDDLTGRARALLHRASGNRAYLRLVAQRKKLRREIIEIAEEMGL